MDSKSMIRIKDLNYEYRSAGKDNFLAVRDFNIDIKKGEFVAILGHNGSGKSTLAKLMNGLYTPTSGDVYINDMNTKDEEKIWDIRKTAGMIFQNPDNQIVATIVEEDVAFGPENLGVPSAEIRKRVDRALEVVDMSEYKDHAPHLLSGGQKQRIAIAGVLAMEPDCIILDEPTAMLDPSGREEVISTIKKLNKEEGKTIILITHFMNEAIEADRVVVMEKGTIALDGSPREVFSSVEEIKNLGLDVPQVTELAFELKKEGIEIDTDILTIEELIGSLC